ncbi:MAG: DUF11 domain-containing protein [Anaerolineae bacterium]|nr:DUF11 domain-containing protein [Anaerolineae bacterium]
MLKKFFLNLLSLIIILTAIYPSLTTQAAPMAKETIAPPSPITLINQIGGGTFSVAIQGDYAYIGVGPRLVTLDITNPANPIAVGQTEVISNYLTDIEIQGNYAYVTEKPYGGYSGSKLRIADISNPALPYFTGFYDTPGDAMSVAVSGNYAYVADGMGGLRILDISNPSQPTEVSTVVPPDPMTRSTKDVIIVDHRAFVAESSQGLHILDISDPANPVSLGRYADRTVEGVAVAGNYAYLGCSVNPLTEAGLAVVDISNPAAPQEVGFYRTGIHSDRIHVRENYAYLATTSSYPANVKSLRIVNITNPATPTLSGTFSSPYDYDTTNESYQFDFTGDFAYLATGTTGLQIVNVANPATPTVIGTYNIPTQPGAIAIAGNHLYVADEHWTLYTDTRDFGDLHVMDIANPAEPQSVGIYDTPGMIHSIAVSGAYAFAGKYVRYDFDTQQATEGGMQILDVSDPAHPAEIGFYDSGKTTVRNIVLQEGRAYLGINDAGAGKIDFVDVSAPATPQHLGQYSDYNAPNDIAISGDYAYLAEQNLSIINIANLSAPAKVGEYGSASTIWSVAVSGDYAYIGTNNLEIIDISNPTEPAFIGSLNIEGSYLISDIAIAGEYAYLAVASKLLIVNIANPQNPVEIAHYDAPGANSIAISGDLIYFTANTGGIYIFSVTPPSTLSGRAIDVREKPIAGAIISANNLFTATTDANGVYTLTNIPIDNYTLTAIKEGILWWEPAQRVVTTPPNAVGQDFVGHHIQKTVSLNSTTAAKAGDQLTYTIAFTYPQLITATVFDPIPVYTAYVPDSLQAPAGFGYDAQLNAITGTVALANTDTVTLTFSVEVTVTGSNTFAPPITNRACLLLSGQSQSDCEWSNIVINATYMRHIYLPLVLRNTN